MLRHCPLRWQIWLLPLLPQQLLPLCCQCRSCLLCRRPPWLQALQPWAQGSCQPQRGQRTAACFPSWQHAWVRLPPGAHRRPAQPLPWRHQRQALQRPPCHPRCVTCCRAPRPVGQSRCPQPASASAQQHRQRRSTAPPSPSCRPACPQPPRRPPWQPALRSQEPSAGARWRQAPQRLRLRPWRLQGLAWSLCWHRCRRPHQRRSRPARVIHLWEHLLPPCCHLQ